MTRLIKVTNNLHKVELDLKPQIKTIIWFSYETPIACLPDQDIPSDLLITKNIWSVTTGKHLNIINPDKSIRIENHVFNEKLKRAINDRLNG